MGFDVSPAVVNASGGKNYPGRTGAARDGGVYEMRRAASRFIQVIRNCGFVHHRENDKPRHLAQRNQVVQPIVPSDFVFTNPSCAAV